MPLRLVSGTEQGFNIYWILVNVTLSQHYLLMYQAVDGYQDYPHLISFLWSHLSSVLPNSWPLTVSGFHPHSSLPDFHTSPDFLGLTKALYNERFPFALLCLVVWGRKFCPTSHLDSKLYCQPRWLFFQLFIIYVAHLWRRGMAIHSSILVWRTPWTEKPVGYMGSRRVGHDWAINTPTHV